jgi:hypothetical protein
MKIALTTILLVLVASGSMYAQRWGYEFGTHYLYAKPVGSMGNIIARGHGVGLNIGFVTPNDRITIGFDLGYAQYGRDKSRQVYSFDDGTTAPMDIIVSNTFLNAVAYSRLYLSTETMLRPYVSGRLGYSGFNTSLNIYDPDDFDHCEPVDNDVLHHDGTFVAGVGGGASIDVASVFKKMDKGRLFFDFNVSILQGGQVRYMNADAPHFNHHGPSTDNDVVMAEFRNTQTQVVHEHHVGYLYDSPLQMTEVRVGAVMKITRE